MKLLYIFVFLCSLLGAGAATAQSGLPVELRGVELSPALADVLSKAVVDHNEARDGKRGLAKEVVARLEEVDADPGVGQAVLLAYMGSAYTLMGRDARSPINALRFTNRGIRIMDEAVEMAPQNFNVRIVRALNNARLPPMFNRSESALNDMRALVALFEARPVAERKPAMVPVFGALIKHAQETGNADEVTLWQSKRDRYGIAG